MKNVALIRVPTVEFSREEVPGHSMFRGGGVDAFTDQLSERLRAALSQRSIPCTAVARTFKPCGSGFTADNAVSASNYRLRRAERDARSEHHDPRYPAEKPQRGLGVFRTRFSRRR